MVFRLQNLALGSTEICQSNLLNSTRQELSSSTQNGMENFNGERRNLEEETEEIMLQRC